MSARMVSSEWFEQARDNVGDRMHGGGVDSLAPDEQVFAVLCEFQDEVNNGGLSQYLHNTGGERVYRVGLALYTIGVNGLAKALDAALVSADFEPGLRHNELAELLEAYEDVLDRFDDKFYKVDDEVEEALRTYVAEHLAVECVVCRGPCLTATAHRHQGGWVGDECCWDERLRTSE